MDNMRKRRAEEELKHKEKEDHQIFDEGYRGQKGDQFQLDKRNRQLGAARGICMRMDAKRAKSRVNQSQEVGAEDLGRSNLFWWIADSVPDEILGTSMMGPSAEEVLGEENRDQEQSLGAEALDDIEDAEFGKQKRIKLDPLQTMDEEEADHEEPKWGERPEFASQSVWLYHYS